MVSYRSICEDDLLSRVEWMNNPLVYRSMHYDLPVCIENTRKWYKSILNNKQRSDIVIFEDANNTILAMGGITNIDNLLRNGELYVFVNPQLHGKGYGKIAVNLICNHAFQVLNLESIFLYTDSDNIRAISLYEKVGFQRSYSKSFNNCITNAKCNRLFYVLSKNPNIK